MNWPKVATLWATSGEHLDRPKVRLPNHGRVRHRQTCADRRCCYGLANISCLQQVSEITDHATSRSRTRAALEGAATSVVGARRSAHRTTHSTPTREAQRGMRCPISCLLLCWHLVVEAMEHRRGLTGSVQNRCSYPARVVPGRRRPCR